MSIEGNKIFSEKEIERDIGRNSPADSIMSGILEMYRACGYFGARADIRSLGNGKTVLEISEGRPAIIDEISFEIYPEMSGLFDDLIARSKGEIASQKTMNDLARAALSRLADSGMPFAAGEWADFDFIAENKLKAKFKIVPGPACVIKDFVFDGIARTRPNTLTRVMNISEGELYSESAVRESEKRIDRLGYVDIASPFELEMTRGGDSCRIIYHIKELPSTRLDGAGGFVRTKNRSDFVGKADLSFGDILGTGRSFGLNWSKKDRFSGELRLNYLEPYILGSKFNMILEAWQVDRDTLYLESGGRAGFEYQLGGGTKAKVAFGLRRVEPERPGKLSSSTSRIVGLSLVYDGSDYAPNPRSGYTVGTGIDYNYRSNRVVIEGDNPPTTITSIGLDAGFYKSVLHSMVAALGVKSWGIVNIDGKAPADELRFIGGFGLLRGYVEQRFPAYRYAVGTAEIRLLTGQQSRAYLFGDFGAVKGSQAINDKYVFHPGFGFGLVSPTALGQFKVEISWGEKGFPTEPIINFGVAGSF